MQRRRDVLLRARVSAEPREEFLRRAPKRVSLARHQRQQRIRRRLGEFHGRVLEDETVEHHAHEMREDSHAASFGRRGVVRAETDGTGERREVSDARVRRRLRRLRRRGVMKRAHRAERAEGFAANLVVGVFESELEGSHERGE